MFMLIIFLVLRRWRGWYWGAVHCTSLHSSRTSWCDEATGVELLPHPGASSYLGDNTTICNIQEEQSGNLGRWWGSLIQVFFFKSRTGNKNGVNIPFIVRGALHKKYFVFTVWYKWKERKKKCIISAFIMASTVITVW